MAIHHRSNPRRMLRVAMPALAALLIVALSVFGYARAAASNPTSVTMPNSVLPAIATSQVVRPHDPNSTISFSVLFNVRNAAGMTALAQALYDPRSTKYHQWLQTGQFASQFGLGSGQIAQVNQFLQQHRLSVEPSASNVLAEVVTGKTSDVAAAFQTSIDDYLGTDGSVFYANAANVRLPSYLSAFVAGVMLTNVAAAQPLVSAAATQTQHSATADSGCGYGPAGGFTPCQISSIYDANKVYSQLSDHGQGSTIALYELSGYTRSDITAYESQFGIPNVPITDAPIFPSSINHSGAAEVELDIQMVLALASGVNDIIVYNAPNNFFLSTFEYALIALNNRAKIVSSSWGICEHNAPPFARFWESLVFTLMALQGQSMYAASADDGAYSCGTATTPGPLALQTDDPASQPFVTAVGGTSFKGVAFDSNYDYPTGQEKVWGSACPNPKFCSGGGGGVSRYFTQPAYQTGPGVNESGFSRSGSWCGASAGTPCREVPDVSLNSDPNSGYAIYCTDTGDTTCRRFAGWFVIGGTSAAAPLWAAITALMVQHGFGGGFMNPFLYSLDGASGACTRLHDITQPGTNGYYPVGPNYDMATGLGSADIYNLVTGCNKSRIWLTGHDPDFHCQYGDQCHYLNVALTYVMNGSTLPVLALDHGTEVATSIANAFGGSAPTVVTVDPRTGFAGLPLVSMGGAPLYSAIVVASDTTCGGCDNNNGYGDTPDSDAINARTADIARFFNAGGGILALAGAENYAVFYNFLPIAATGANVTSPFTFTAFGLSLGLVEGSDDNCCVTHNSFLNPTSGSPYQVAETDGAGLAETLVAQGAVPLSMSSVVTKEGGTAPQVPQNPR